MGEKISGITEMDFSVLDEGYYIMKVEEASVEKNRGEGKNGWLYKLTASVQGGQDDGAKHFENFPSQSKKNFGVRRLVGFMEKLGVLTPGREYDSDSFESDGFEKKFKSIINKLYGVKIGHQQSTKDKTKVIANSVAYYTVKEVQEKMGGKAEGRTVVEKTEAAPAKEDDAWT